MRCIAVPYTEISQKQYKYNKYHKHGLKYKNCDLFFIQMDPTYLEVKQKQFSHSSAWIKQNS